MASHILDEVEKICSHVAVLKQGNLLTYGPIAAVLNKQEQVYVASDDLDLLGVTLGQIEGVSNIKKTSNKIYLLLAEGKTSAYLNKALFDKGIVLTELGVQKPDLESNFLELVK